MKINKKLKLFLVALFVAFFIFVRNGKSQGNSIIIIEIYPYPESGKEEFVKIKNVSEEKIDLSGWKIIDNANVVSHKYEFPNGTEIEAGEIILLERNFYLNNSGSDAVYLFDNLTDIKEKDLAIDKVTYEKAKENFVYVFNGKNWEWKFKVVNEEDENEDEDENNENEEDEEKINYFGKIIINEIYPCPESGEEEFIEIKNISEENIDISGWKIIDNANVASHKYEFPKDTVIKAGKTISKERNFYLNNDYDIVYLFDAETDVEEKKFALDKKDYEYPVTKKGYSYSFNGNGWCWTEPTFNGENKFDEVIREDKEESEVEVSDLKKYKKSKYKIKLNEILPNPKGEESKKEYIEIFSKEKKEINLEGWVLKDSSSGKFVFPENYEIKPKKYRVIYRDDFKFALNNTGGEEVYLFDLDGNLASSVIYSESAKKNVSYNLDGNNWHWSKKLTPGKKNKFSSLPKVKVDKIKSGFVGIPIEFSVSVDYDKKKDLKYRWDFGDSRRSYLEDTKHTYLKKGKYEVSLSVDNGVEKVQKSFEIEIEKYPRFDVSIESLMSNPVGKDTENEWIQLKNNSKKKVNLRGWKIATGKDDLINHPIYNDFYIESGGSVKITRRESYFYLNNKEMKIELRHPDGKVASKVKYKKDKIEEGEICQVEKGKCVWIFIGVPKEDIQEENIVATEGIVLTEEKEVALPATRRRGGKKEPQIKFVEKFYLSSFEKKFPVKIIFKENLVYEIEDKYYFVLLNKRPYWVVELLNSLENEIFSFFV